MSEAFPLKWINKKWREGFHVTAMATAGSKWAIVMSHGARFSDQVVELDFLYPSEGIHRRWDGGYRITSTAATWHKLLLFLVSQEESMQMRHRKHCTLLCFLVHMLRSAVTFPFLSCFIFTIIIIISFLMHDIHTFHQYFSF
uniref:DUF7477 domain-containing protein n=1 Tax=Lactuca sativa TaxID=4236 RepID=A0A9R1UDV8_LACSA|nr:hypothetical protein LSAT_V11C900503470 [Lactuca sativa]